MLNYKCRQWHWTCYRKKTCLSWYEYHRVDLNQENLNKLKKTLSLFGINVGTYLCDVADEQIFKDFSEDCLSKFKKYSYFM